MIKIKVIQFNKYKNQHNYDYIDAMLDYAKESNIELALCFKTEDVYELFDVIDKELKITAVTMNKDIIDRLSGTNYVDLNSLKEY